MEAWGRQCRMGQDIPGGNSPLGEAPLAPLVPDHQGQSTTSTVRVTGGAALPALSLTS